MPALVSDREDVALSLTLAVVSASPAPLLLLNGELSIVAASNSFQVAFGLLDRDLATRQLYALSGGRWDIPALRDLLAATLAGDEQEDDCQLELKPEGEPSRHLLVQARRLDYLDLDETRILVAVSDVTEALADTALKEKAARYSVVLLQEVRHRIANSLQIIASVLFQNARQTPSEEARRHLKDAHHRVMSVAALERLLSTSEAGDVDVPAYFTSLCESISASIIGTTVDVTLAVDGGEGVIDARLSVSLGLIITELVINALKYAFPDGRTGRIDIDYKFDGPNWVICVRDDGVGMPLVAPARKGLGMGIVAALAEQIDASVTTLPAHPGTRVSIEHTQIATADYGPEVSSTPAATALAPIIGPEVGRS